MNLLEFIPHPAQVRVISEKLVTPHRAVLADPGVGKTPMALEAFCTRRERFEARRLLVISTIPVCAATWPKEIAKWRRFAGLRYVFICGSPTERLERMRQPADVYAINFELLPWLVKQKWDWPDTLEIDESSRLKSIGARWRAARKVMDRFEYRNIETGTPSPNGMLDLWPQIYLLDKGAALGDTLGKYQTDYFVGLFRGTHNEWVLRTDDCKEQIYAKLRPLCSRISRSELPNPTAEPIVIEREVQLPPRALELYRAVLGESYARLSKGEILAPNSGARDGKLRQIANGAVYLSEVYDNAACDTADGRPFEKIHAAKLDAVESLVEELSGQPIVIFFEFRHDLAALRTLFPKAPCVGRGLKPAELSRLVDEWNARRVPVLLFHPQAAAHGLNLQEGGHHMAWYSLPWDLEVFQQARCRIWRQGQRETVMEYHITATGTIDQRVSRALQRKDLDQRGLLDALRHDIGGMAHAA